MIDTIKNFIQAWGQMEVFKKLPPEGRRLVIYSRDSQDWLLFAPIIEKFFELQPTEKITYVTSDKNDPGLKFNHTRYTGLWIGSGAVRTIFFKALYAKLFLTSLPNLEVSHLKRSLGVEAVHYAYCFNSKNSIHEYGTRAFEFYDMILCLNKEQVSELIEEEKQKKMRPRQLLHYTDPSSAAEYLIRFLSLR